MTVTHQKVFSRIVDSVVAFVLVVGAVIQADQQPARVHDITVFLQMRITLWNVIFAVIFVLLWTESFLVADALMRRCRSLLRCVATTAAACALMTVFVNLYLLLRNSPAPVALITGRFFAAALLCQLIRLFTHRAGWLRRSETPENVIILGSGRRASQAWRELRIRYGRTANLLGFVDNRSLENMPPDIAQRYLCDVSQLSDFLLRTSVQRMIVATPLRSQFDMTQEAVSIAEDGGLRVSCMIDLFRLRHARPARERADLFVELVPQDDQFRFADHVKRLFDVTVSAAGLLVLSPVFLLIALAVRLSSPGPVFFRQERYGYRRRKFFICKFRSMVADAPARMQELEKHNEAEGPIFKIRKDPRITPVGRILRAFSLDELPQLWNVLVGEMSLVGPRPMSIRDVSLFSDAVLMRRFSVKPGITGLWQVSGRSTLSFDKWIALDFRYIDEWSLALDMKILARTLPVVIKRTGAA